MLDAGPRRRPHQVAGLLLVALSAARAVQDGPDPVHRALDSLAGGQIADRELDAILGLVAAPTEHPHLAVGLAQERHDEAPERAGATGDQN